MFLPTINLELTFQGGRPIEGTSTSDMVLLTYWHRIRLENRTWTSPKDAPDNVKYSWENWHYRYVDGLGENVDLEFVDAAGSGEYLLRIGLKDKNTSIFEPYHNTSHDDAAAAISEKIPLNVYTGHGPVPLIRYKDLEGMAISKIIRDQVCFGQRIRFVRATHASTMATIVVDTPKGQSSATTKDSKSQVVTKYSGA